MKKIIALLLAAIMLAAILLSCTDNGGNKGSETSDTKNEGTDSEEINEDDVPKDLKFDGYNFVICFPNPADAAMDYQLIDDGEAVSVIDTAVYNRNAEVEDRFGITLEGILAGNSDTQVPELINMATGGDDEYDLAQIAFTFSGIPWMTSGYAGDWTTVDYIDLDKNYWSQSMTQNLGVLGHSFLIQGKINWTSMMSTQVCFFNTQVVEDNNVENLYKAVNDKSWTFEKLRTIAKPFTKDLNTDDIYDINDQYGIIQSFYGGMYNWSIAADYITVSSTEDGLVCNYNTPKFTSIVEYVYDLLYNDNTAYVEKYDYVSESEGIKVFFADRAMFLFTDLGHGDFFRAEKSDYGIIPTPMYDEAQGKYCTTNDQWGLSCGIPKTASNPARTGAITEVLCALSAKEVYPVYYDTVLSVRNTRDEESRGMLDIIFSNIVYDAGITLAKYESYIPMCSLMNITKHSTDVASWAAKYQPKLQSMFDDLYSYVEENY